MERLTASTTVAPILEASQLHWTTALENGDVETAYELISQDSEKYCCARAWGDEFVPSQFRGRGKARLEKHCTVPLKQHHDYGIETARFIAVQKFSRRAEEVVRKITARGACDDAQDLWQLVMEEAPKWGLLRPRTAVCPTLQEAWHFVLQVRKLVDRERSRQADERRESWAEWSKREWTATGKQQIYRFCQSKHQGAIPILQQKNGQLTGDYSTMDRLLREEWHETFNLYASIPRPSWEAFEAAYGRFFPRTRPMTPTRLTPARLQEVLSKMDPNTSIGPDSWRVRELRKLPPEILQRFCELFEAIEATGKWPTSLAIGLVAPLTKGEGMGPGDVRPITVTSVVYRAWAACRVQELISWQQGWLSKKVSSYRPEAGCEDIWLTQALAIEHALLFDEPIAGISLDFAKAFDRIPVHILLRLAKTIGVEEGIINAMTGMYQQMQRRWKVGPFIGEAFTSMNGILQGCPLSVVLLNTLIHIWVCAVEELEPTASPSAYADDLGAYAPTARAIKGVLRITQRFCELTGMLLKASKSAVWATSARLRAQLNGCCRVGAKAIPLLMEDRNLGAYVSYTRRKCKSRIEHTKQECNEILSRIESLHLHLEARAHLVAAMVLPKALYGTAVAAPAQRSLSSLRAKSARAVWGQGNRWRAVEALFNLFTKSHLVDPVQKFAYDTIVTFRRVLRRRPEFVGMYERILGLRSTQRVTTPGPVAALLSAARHANVTFDEDQPSNMFYLSEHDAGDLMEFDGVPLAGSRCRHWRIPSHPEGIAPNGAME